MMMTNHTYQNCIPHPEDDQAEDQPEQSEEDDFEEHYAKVIARGDQKALGDIMRDEQKAKAILKPIRAEKFVKLINGKRTCVWISHVGLRLSWVDFSNH